MPSVSLRDTKPCRNTVDDSYPLCSGAPPCHQLTDYIWALITFASSLFLILLHGEWRGCVALMQQILAKIGNLPNP